MTWVEPRVRQPLLGIPTPLPSQAPSLGFSLSTGKVKGEKGTKDTSPSFVGLCYSTYKIDHSNHFKAYNSVAFRTFKICAAIISTLFQISFSLPQKEPYHQSLPISPPRRRCLRIYLFWTPGRNGILHVCVAFCGWLLGIMFRSSIHGI